jgi:hypothetical protein
LGTFFRSLIAILAASADLRNDSPDFPGFVNVYADAPITPELIILHPFPLNRIYILFG